MFLPQLVLSGRIKANTAGDGELIVFKLPMGMLTLLCIVNIPGEGEEEAPVYVKFRFNGGRPQQRPNRLRSGSRERDEDE
jgi:hypothetical protein